MEDDRMVAQTCPYKIVRKAGKKTIEVTCRSCREGNATIFDPVCRSHLFSILSKEHGSTRLVLQHSLIKVYSGQQLQILLGFSQFIDAVSTFNTVNLDSKSKTEKTAMYLQVRNDIEELKTKVQSDPISVYYELKKIRSQLSQKIAASPLFDTLNELLWKGDLHRFLTEESVDSNQFYTTHLNPYVRPGFIDSYIHLEPPGDAVFLQSYEINRKNRRPLTVSLYTLQNRPEKLYFVVPPEFDLPRDELQLLEKVRSHLSKHRPKDASFLDAETAREYFQHFARNTIASLLETLQLSIPASRIDYLADVFARYTAGFGILEDLLLDHHIQDIYVNAPVAENPLHLVVDGEEYTSNVFLSHGDIDALASRFRTLSGRAFSEASPVLDMDLQGFRTRVAAISNPLTPKGIAFAFRRHRQKPWTLAHFVANKMLSAQAAGLLSFLVDGQASLLIAGSRGAGKTSLLSSLILEIPQRFRILTIEDTAEIPVEDFQQYNYKIQSLITKSIASQSTAAEVDPTDALRTALRLGESVLVLGEVRGVEAKVLFEAMRVGAAGNLIMGTIHGSTTRDVYERVVYDIGVPPTSFKAVDAVVIAAPIREEGGIERKRRITQISEITKKGWTTAPDADHVFQDIMTYDTATDTMNPTPLLNKHQSTVIQSIARKWGISLDKAMENINLRAHIKQQLVEQSTQYPELLEAPAVRDANNQLWMLIETSRQHHDTVDYQKIQRQWDTWLTYYVGRMQ